MAFLKVALAVSTLLAAVALTRAEPPNNQYLPPSSGGNGYNYERPSVPFPRPPSPPPPTPSYRPPSPPAPRPTYSAPTSTGGYDYNAQANLPQSHGGDHDDHHHHEPGMPYDFNYAVKDDYYGTDYSRNEVSDGNVITGEYRVQLPDGRLQIVRYTADWQNGYNADVSYEGEAKYPEPKINTNTNVNQQYGPPPSNGGYQYRRK